MYKINWQNLLIFARKMTDASSFLKLTLIMK